MVSLNVEEENRNGRTIDMKGPLSGKAKRVFSTVSAYKSPARGGKMFSTGMSPGSTKSRKVSMKSYNMAIFKKDVDANTIDFSATDGTGGGDAWSRVMNRKDSNIIDIDNLVEESVLEKSRAASHKRLKRVKRSAPGESKAATERSAAKTMQEDESISILDRIKRSAHGRFAKGSTNYARYCDVAKQFFMGKMPGTKHGQPSLAMSLDSMQKSDAKVLGYILADFPILHGITLWSDVINIPSLERRDAMAEVPRHLKAEYERTKLSQNVRENNSLFT